MKHLYDKFCAYFRKPQLLGIIAKGGKGAKVRIIKVSLEESIVILYAICLRLEQTFKVDRRYILNKVLAADSALKKDKKREEKEVRRQIYGNKK